MRKKRGKIPKYPDYDRIDTEKQGIITFGTTVYIRKDRLAIKIDFPVGHSMTFAPLDDDELKSGKNLL